MASPAFALAAAGLAIVLGTWAAYLATVPGGNVPARPIGSIALQIAGSGLAAAALVVGVRGGALLAAVVPPAALALVMGPLFLFLLSQRKTPIGELAVSVGDVLLPFSATTAEGESFHTDSLATRRVLLKFFRGNW